MMRRTEVDWQREEGLTLVELLIAIALSLILLAVLTTTFVTNSQTRNEMERTSRQIENGRYAMQSMIDDLTNAGFWGGAVAGFAAEPEFCAVSSIKTSLLTPALWVLTKTQATALSPNTCIVNMKDGTNAVVIRRFSTSTTPTATAKTCGSDPLPSGANCFEVDDTSTPVVVNNGVAGVKKIISGEFAAVRVPVTHIYYVNTSNTLVRATLAWSGGNSTFTQEAVADGIELLAASVTPDITTESPIVPKKRRVTLEILARNTEGSPGYVDAKTYTVGGVTVGPLNDNIRRQYYSSNVNVENDT